MKFYDWARTFSYSKARWVLVISARGYGKTYGLRKQCVRDCIKKKRRFVEVVRYKTELADIARGYFDKLKINNEFPGCEFKYETNCFYMRKGEGKWECIGYIVALTDEQIAKRITFANVKRFIFDEGLIEHKDRYKRYLPREFERLVGLVSSVMRPIPRDGKSYIQVNGKEIEDDSTVYILGNAVDYTCPYFENLGIDKIPKYGRHIYRNGDVLLDYVEPIYYDQFAKDTAIGRALSGKSESAKLFRNEFEGAHSEYVEPMPKGSKFWRGYVFGGHVFAIWLGVDNYAYVSEKAPRNAKLAAFTLDDDTINYDLLRKSGADARMLRELFFKKLMRYETPIIRERYSDMLISLGMV